MKKLMMVAGVGLCFAVGLLYLAGDAGADQVVISGQASQASDSELPIVSPAPGTYKKCGFNSDCKGYGKCKSGKCGACGFKSDCGGWGICKSGKCGACNFDSECKKFGKCSGGRCTKSPY